MIRHVHHFWNEHHPLSSPLLLLLVEVAGGVADKSQVVIGADGSILAMN